jgi:hypothetical protein
MVLLCCVAFLGGCASHQRRGRILSLEQITAPEPVQGNTAQYMCPYSRDGKFTVWMLAAMDATTARETERPMPDGDRQPPSGPPPEHRRTGNTAEAVARDAKRQHAAAHRGGGFEFIRDHTELSFSSADDLCLYLYAKHSHDAGYGQVFDYMAALYPDMGRRCPEALRKASSGSDEGRGGPGEGGPSGGMGGGPGGGMGGGPGGMGGGRGGCGGILY